MSYARTPAPSLLPPSLPHSIEGPWGVGTPTPPIPGGLPIGRSTRVPPRPHRPHGRVASPTSAGSVGPLRLRTRGPRGEGGPRASDRSPRVSDRGRFDDRRPAYSPQPPG